MKLKRLSSLVGLLAALLIFTSGRVLAVDAIAVADAYAFPGGSDTVDVLVTTVRDYPGAEITLSYDKAALSTQEANVIVNEAAWNPSWGDKVVKVDTLAGTVTVALFSLSGDTTQAVPQSSSALKLFSVVFSVDSAATVGSYTITPSGIFTYGYGPTEVTVSSLTSGSLIVQNEYNMSVDSVEAGPGVLVPVGVNMVNGREIVSLEFTIVYDSSQVVYGDSIEINDLYVGGAASAPVVNNYGDSIKVAIYTTTTATIPVSNTSRWIAKVYMVSADSAVESASNPLTLSDNTTVVTTTGPPDYVFVDNVPGRVPGNIDIQSSYALRVADAAAPQGGSDTVNVYLRSSETIVGVEAELLFDKDNFTVSESNVDFNDAIFASGAPGGLTVVPTDSTVKVLAYGLATDSIAASNSERLLFSVILGVKDSASTGYDSIDATSTLVTRDTNYNLTEVEITSITKGAFRILAPYEISVKSRSAGPESRNVPVTIQLTNQADIYAAEIVVKYDTSAVTYVTGSVVGNPDIWTGVAPTPVVSFGGDSIKIAFEPDQSDFTNRIAGGSANRALLTIGFDLDSSLVDGDTTWLTPSGLLIGVDNYNPVEYTPDGIIGYVAVASDIVPPEPVTNATATAVGTTVSLSWKNPVASDLDYVKIQRREGSETVAVVTRDTPVPGANDSYDELGVPAGIYYYDFIVADLNGNVGNVVSVGPVTVGVPTGNNVTVRNRVARPGGMALPRIALTNTDSDIAGVSLKVTFDNTLLMLTDITPGAEAAGLAPVSVVDIDSANASGVIMLDMIDLDDNNPVIAGSTLKRIAVLNFMVDSSAVPGDTAALTVSDVSLSDAAGEDVLVTASSGYVAITAKASTDLNGDGLTNTADIWYYINMDEMVQFESLVELIVDLLSRPLPTTLAAVQDATATANYRVDDGAALINLKTDYEIVAVRFTFSYDTMYQFESVGLNPALAGQLMIKQVVSDGRLYVDVIGLGGFIPAEIGEIFSVTFRDTDHQTAGLTLERVETADRDGNVRIEAAKVNRIALPKAYSLSQNSPNPFNPSTTIKYQVPEGDAARVQIVVYNIRGQKVITLVDELKESGDYSVNWSGQSASGQRVSSGVYFYRMSADEFSAMRKMVIVK
ncbi:cohesin domain-containing protein [Gemmatimonadota bacterium]